MLAIALELAQRRPGLRGRRDQVLRALPAHRRAPSTTWAATGIRPVGRGGRLLLRRAAPARRRGSPAQGPLAGRADPAASPSRPSSRSCSSAAGVRAPPGLVPRASARTSRRLVSRWRRARHGRAPAALALVRGHRHEARCSRACSTRSEFLSRPRHPVAVAVPPRRSRTCSSSTGRPHASTTSRRSRRRAVRRQLQLARARLVPDQLPDHRGAAEVPPLLRRRLPGRVPDRLGPSSRSGEVADELTRRLTASSSADETAAGPCSAARTRSSRPALARRPRCSTSTSTATPATGPRGEPPDGLDGARRHAPRRTSEDGRELAEAGPREQHRELLAPDDDGSRPRATSAPAGTW